MREPALHWRWTLDIDTLQIEKCLEEKVMSVCMLASMLTVNDLECAHVFSSIDISIYMMDTHGFTSGKWCWGLCAAWGDCLFLAFPLFHIIARSWFISMGGKQTKRHVAFPVMQSVITTQADTCTCPSSGTCECTYLQSVPGESETVCISNNACTQLGWAEIA